MGKKKEIKISIDGEGPVLFGEVKNALIIGLKETPVKNGCSTCKHCHKCITDEPCMDCDPRKDAPNNHWEADDGN